LSNAHNTFAADCFDEKIKYEQGFFDSNGTDTDTFYQSFGFVLGNPKWQEEFPKVHKKYK